MGSSTRHSGNSGWIFICPFLLLGLISPSSVCVALRGRRPEARKRGRRRGGSKIAEKMRAGVAAVRDPRAQAHLGVGMGAWRTANWMGRLPLGKVTDGPNGYGKVEAESWESPMNRTCSGRSCSSGRKARGGPFPVLPRHKTPPECPAWSHGGAILEAGPGSCRSGLPGAAARLSASVHRCFSWVRRSMGPGPVVRPAGRQGGCAPSPAISRAYPVHSPDGFPHCFAEPVLSCGVSPCWS